MAGYFGDPEIIQQAVDRMGAGEGGLEGDLRNLQGVQTSLAQAINSPGVGKAVDGALLHAWQSGTALAQKVQEVINVLHQNGMDINAHDLDGQAAINAASVHAGDTVNTGSAPSLNLNI